MKLKNILMICFAAMTLVPAALITALLYKSGLNLAEESYVRNITESINVQADYIRQTVEDTIVQNGRFILQYDLAKRIQESGPGDPSPALLEAFRFYLDLARDQMMACILLDGAGNPLYTIGEQAPLEQIEAQLPLGDQPGRVREFRVGDTYSLGVITPIQDGGETVGSLVAVYQKRYLFKRISSYYKAIDSVAYILRENGETVDSAGAEGALAKAVAASLARSPDSGGRIEVEVGNDGALGYYTAITGTPWYLAGFISDKLVYSFVNSFLWVYLLATLALVLAGILLSVWISRKVAEPIHALISVMRNYENALGKTEPHFSLDGGYAEIRYLADQFAGLMHKFFSAQRNLENMFELYRSIDAVDINIDIDVVNRAAHSNQEHLQHRLDQWKGRDTETVLQEFAGFFSSGDREGLFKIFQALLAARVSVTHEIDVCSPDERQWFHMLIVPMYEDERLSKIFLQLRDISALKQRELESARQARKDGLTGLLNRLGFTERVEAELEKGGADHALLFIDMDRFKEVNDNFGHEKGDEVLVSVGRALTELGGEIAARLGGDEFVLFLPNRGEAAANDMAAALRERLRYTFALPGGELVVTASIGCALWEPPESFGQLLRRADRAMYASKRAGRASAPPQEALPADAGNWNVEEKR